MAAWDNFVAGWNQLLDRATGRRSRAGSIGDTPASQDAPAGDWPAYEPEEEWPELEPGQPLSGRELTVASYAPALSTAAIQGRRLVLPEQADQVEDVRVVYPGALDQAGGAPRGGEMAQGADQVDQVDTTGGALDVPEWMQDVLGFDMSQPFTPERIQLLINLLEGCLQKAQATTRAGAWVAILAGLVGLVVGGLSGALIF